MNYTNDRKQKLTEIFEDTKHFYNEVPALKAAVKYGIGNTRLYEADDYPELPEASPGRAGDIRVTKHKTFEAAMLLRREFPDKRIAVLNFASASRPGGGVTTGASAQEECLCRCSTLYPALSSKPMWDRYYSVNRSKNDVLHTDACIYTPGVVICKTDELFPVRMEPEDFVTVDVISCAAPNLRNKPSNQYNPERGRSVNISDKKLYEIHISRAKHILHIAAANSADILVLGAFGCGAFRNDPGVVAAAYRDAAGSLRKYFDLMEFAVYCKENETANYDAFSKKLGKL